MNTEPWVPVFFESQGLGLQDWITVGVGFGGAILGSVVGGFIAYLLQRASQRSEQETLAVSATVKASMVLGDIDAIMKIVNRAFIAPPTADSPRWARLNHFVALPSPQVLDHKELSPFLKAKRYALVDGYIELISRSETLFGLVREYSERRASLDDILSNEMHNENGKFEWRPTEQQDRKTAFARARLDSQAGDIHQAGNALLKLAKVVNRDMGAAGQAIFGSDFPSVNLHEDPTQQSPAPGTSSV